MKMSQVALQCYTIRDHCRTAPEFAESMRRARAIGYETVQISGVGPIPPSEIYTIANGEGLQICATHEPGIDIIDRPEQVVETLAALHCKLTAYPWPHISLETIADVDRFAEGLNRSGAVLKAAGMQLCFHNHDMEFRKLDGKTVLERLYEKTDPNLVMAELDTYWVHAGGGDVVSWCTRMVGRLPMIHLKDYAMRAKERQPIFAPLGEGNLEFPRIISVAEQSGCQWFIVEQDSGFDDAFEAIATSLRYLREHVAS
ncbi:MAG TPA: sugar phosphate isomerase/epimerase [Polyangiaceae bacterium]|jgi:sugar phosphate isomerase/epimerase